mmetsp:Transcript_56400/g.123870  ORF Transcript_56400/g.123870 Transcript_56400/m.123870 type:complete len:137 (-) Transcript_56400:142-552(-)
MVTGGSFVHCRCSNSIADESTTCTRHNRDGATEAPYEEQSPCERNPASSIAELETASILVLSPGLPGPTLLSTSEAMWQASSSRGLQALALERGEQGSGNALPAGQPRGSGTRLKEDRAGGAAAGSPTGDGPDSLL